ncbi:MAG: sulfite exporter TauE/SafE family protein [Alphaproteobacteria bacterium]
MEFQLEWLFAAMVVFIAYMVRGMAGFGSGLIAVPLLAMVFPVHFVVPVVVLFDYIGSASQGIRNHDKIVWREELVLIPFTLVGVALGLTVLQSLASSTLKQALAVFVIIYAVYQILPLPVLRGSRVLAVPCGLLGGMIGTLFGTGGPFYIIYFNLRGLDKDASRATFSANFLIDGAIRLAAFASFGLLTGDMALAILAGLPLIAAGLWVGGRAHAIMSTQAYVHLVSILLFVSGIILLLRN